jgi:hypothetical protein
MKKTGIFLLMAFVLQTQAQVKITTIPFELYGDHMFIKVSLDDSEPLDFIFDTGAGLTVIDDEVATDLNLSSKEVNFSESDARFALIKHNKIEINGFLMEKNIKVYATDLNHLEMSLGREFDGIVGYDLLWHHTVHIDYDNLTMDIYDHGNGPKDGDPIPFDLYRAIPTVKGKIVLNNGEAHEGDFFVMTGAGTTLDINTPYAEEWNVLEKTGKHFSYPVKGIGKKEDIYYEGHVISFEWGQQKIEDLPIGISTSPTGIHADKKAIGIIGNRILREFNITIDVPDKMIWVEKNSHFGEKLNVNSCGMDLQLSEDKEKILVHYIMENSPASEAGIQLNAELVSVNGKPAGEYALPDIQTLLRRDGTTVDLVLLENGQEKSYSLELRKMID